MPKVGALNFQKNGEVQKTKQPSYAAVAGRSVVASPKMVVAAQKKPGCGEGVTVQGGYMLECTNQTEAECLGRMLFGAPQNRLAGMKEHIKAGSTVFLYNKDSKAVRGPYAAVSDPGWKLEKDAWSTVGKGRGFPAQVRVQAQGTVRRVMVRKCEALKGGPMTAAQVKEYLGAVGGHAMPKPREISAAQDTVVSAAQAQEPQGARQQQGAVNNAPAGRNKTVEGVVMPQPREVSAAQDTVVSGKGAEGQGGYMFNCTRQTEAECLERMLFGAPEKDMLKMKGQIKVGSAVFLYNTDTGAVMGPFAAAEEPSRWVEKDAWNTSSKKFAAQVRVQAQGTLKRWPVARRCPSGSMAKQEVEKGKQSEWGGTVMVTR